MQTIIRPEHFRAWLIILLLVFHLPVSWGVELVELPREVFAGDPLPLRIYTGPEVEEIQVALVRSENTSTPVEEVLVRGNGFLLGKSSSEIERKVWLALLGVPSTAIEGQYQVRVGSSKRLLSTEVIYIRGQQFFHEEIPLDQEMTDLRTEESERKIAELQELLKRVNQFDPDSIFHQGCFQLPVEGFRRTSGFGDRRTFLYTGGTTDRSIHTGIDFATPKGTPVHACARGQVVLARNRILTGNTVVLEHLPGIYSLYYHLDAIEVKEGAGVSRGSRIGMSGATGLVTGPHLHWEIRTGGVPVNPEAFVEGGALDKFLELGETPPEFE
ncbi:MAG TPA: M23 family metallopeptidase [Spirochaetales bacterium]|nr:M23 family metallopeptidase [Spirochaetales bacterium]